MTATEVPSDWDEECDVLVAGSGGGALTGALSAAGRGMDTLVAEKTAYYGGTTAYAGACLWLPGNRAQERAGLADSAQLARTYFRAVVGDTSPHALQDAYLDHAGALVEEMEGHPDLRFEHRPFPDYFPAPGRFARGRGVFPVDLPEPEDTDTLLGAVRPAARRERLGVAPTREPLTDGRALIGRLLLALRRTGRARCRLHTCLTRLVTGEDGAVLGAKLLVCPPGGESRVLRVRARRGVLLAAGGFEASAQLRRAWQGMPGADWTMGAPGGNTGDAILAGLAAGGDTALLDQAWWCPSLLFPDGSANFTLGVRGGVFVDGTGRRFANESLPYDRMGRAMREAGVGTEPARPVWWVFDGRWGDEVPGIVTVPADRAALSAAGLWRSAGTVGELAARTGIDRAGLSATVRDFNFAAATGTDTAFHRGEDPYDLFFADGAGPNPALTPLDRGPFHAVRLVLGDLGTKGGLRTDTRARVLRADGSVIPGLYATGNTMASPTGAAYPGPGAPIGSAMVFGRLAAVDMARGPNDHGPARHTGLRAEQEES
ncbi:FAD-binding protein [Streptomyces albidoflavus]